MGLAELVRRGEKKGGYPVLERCTGSIRRAMYFARHEAQRRREMVITVSDLLSGLSVENDTRAVRIAALKENSAYLRWLLGLPALPSAVAPDHEGHPVLDGDAKRALSFAVSEADRDGEYWIDSDHLLRGLLRFPNKAHFALLKTEINLTSVRIASRRDREQHHSDRTPNLKVVHYLATKYIGGWAPTVVGAACYLYILFQNLYLSMSASGAMSPLAR